MYPDRDKRGLRNLQGEGDRERLPLALGAATVHAELQQRGSVVTVLREAAAGLLPHHR